MARTPAEVQRCTVQMHAEMSEQEQEERVETMKSVDWWIDHGPGLVVPHPSTLSVFRIEALAHWPVRDEQLHIREWRPHRRFPMCMADEPIAGRRVTARRGVC